MAYASFHDSNPTEPRELTSGGLNETKAIAKIYGYMGLGLLITGLVAFFGAWLFSSQINQWLSPEGFADFSKVDLAKGWSIALLASWIVSIIAILILSIVIPVKAAHGTSLWAPYILYSFFMGVLLTAVLLAGIPFYMIGEAFGITVLAFLAMFAFGWFTKKNLSVLGYIAFFLLITILLTAIVGGITLAFAGSFTTRFWFNIGIQGAMILVILLITAVDTWRIKKIVARAGESTNIYLFCAYVMYTDFISLLLRILYIIAKLQKR